MRDVRGNSVLSKFLSGQQGVCELRRRGRTFAFSAAALGSLFVALNFAPVALGQSQSGSSSASTAQAPAQASAPSSAQAKTQESSQSEPQMLDQSGPPA